MSLLPQRITIAVRNACETRANISPPLSISSALRKITRSSRKSVQLFHGGKSRAGRAVKLSKLKRIQRVRNACGIAAEESVQRNYIKSAIYRSQPTPVTRAAHRSAARENSQTASRFLILDVTRVVPAIPYCAGEDISRRVRVRSYVWKRVISSP